MGLNSSGTISMGGSTAGQSINLEMSYSATATISLNDTAIRGLGGKASGAISLSDFWGKANTMTFYYIVVSGGGGGGGMGDAGHAGGGGGAGGYITGTYTGAKPSSYTVTVGGAGGQSSISGVGHVTVYAGGRGNGGSGGSGGGGQSNDTGSSGTSGGSGVDGQGTGGASGGSGSWVAGGGGGINGGAGRNGGGAGQNVDWNGTVVTLAYGGNGGKYSPSYTGPSGAANTGGGGGGGGRGSGNGGGSGVVYIRYLGSQSATGGTITSYAGYTCHKFTASGTFSLT